ncbi:hypothetical protein NKH77_48260 [Streptomyces sp. M19]
MRARPLLGVVSGSILIPAAVAQPWIGLIAILCPIALLCCVVLPGVWSAKPGRRRDSRAMVELLLGRSAGRRP